MTGTVKNKLPPRLSRRADFDRVTRCARRVRRAFMQVFVGDAFQDGRNGQIEKDGRVKNNGQVGFVVSRRAAANSVKRNRIKRLMREAVRKWWRYIQPGHDIVVMAVNFPKYDHGDYVETVFLKLLVTARVLTEDGSEMARGWMAEIERKNPEFRQ